MKSAIAYGLNIDAHAFNSSTNCRNAAVILGLQTTRVSGARLPANAAATVHRRQNLGDLGALAHAGVREVIGLDYGRMPVPMQDACRGIGWCAGERDLFQRRVEEVEDKTIAKIAQRTICISYPTENFDVRYDDRLGVATAAQRLALNKYSARVGFKVAQYPSPQRYCHAIPTALNSLPVRVVRPVLA